MATGVPVHLSRLNAAQLAAFGRHVAQRRATTAGVFALALVLLWRGGAAPWRLAAVLALQLSVVGILVHVAGREPSADRVFATRIAIAVGNAATVAISGGLHSPLLINLVGSTIGGLVLLGGGRRSATLLALVLLCTAACAVMPAAWCGLAVREPYYALLAAEAVAVTLAMAWSAVRTAAAVLNRAEADLARMRAAVLDDAHARVRSLETIGARVAHELKNPLTAVKGLLPLLARGATDARSRARFDVVAGEVARIEAVLRDYLSFSRPLDALEPAPVALGPLLDEVLVVLEGRAAVARVALRRAGAHDARIEGDGRRLRDALLSLVSNALDATPAGGAVEVALEATDAGAAVRVQDTGRGIAPEHLARVGTPYFTTRAEGTGLGVVLARAVVQQHGGALAYASVPGRGTTATVTLPRALPAGAATAQRLARG